MPKPEPKKRQRRAAIIAQVALTWDGRISTRADPALGPIALLTDRIGPNGRASSLRVVVSDSGRFDPQLAATGPLVIFSTPRMPAATRAVLAPIADLWLHEGRTVRLHEMLETVRTEYRVQRLICEGGGPLFRRLLDAGLVDELHLTLSPQVGDLRASTLTGGSGNFLAQSIPLTLRAMKVVAGECLLRYRVGQS